MILVAAIFYPLASLVDLCVFSARSLALFVVLPNETLFCVLRNSKVMNFDGTGRHRCKKADHSGPYVTGRFFAHLSIKWAALVVQRDVLVRILGLRALNLPFFLLLFVTEIMFFEVYSLSLPRFVRKPCLAKCGLPGN